MTPLEAEAIITAVIRSAVPEKGILRSSSGLEYQPEAGLADVLAAVKAKNPSNIIEGFDGTYYDEGEESYYRIALRLLKDWNLSLPLEKQSDEVKIFLGNLLK